MEGQEIILSFKFIKKKGVIVVSRMSWDEYFINIVDVIGQRATCDRGKSGALIVRDKRILTTGYVGSPQGLSHCDEEGHIIHTVIDENGKESKHCVRTLHAEENAILQAAQFGPPLVGATLYCKMTPCFRCAMKIIRVGIVRVVVKKRYHTEARTIEWFKKAKIQLDILEDKIEEYENQ